MNNADRRRRRTTVEMNLGQYLQPCPCPNGSRPWAAGELALLGTMTDHALALRLSRSVNAVRSMRQAGSRRTPISRPLPEEARLSPRRCGRPSRIENDATPEHLIRHQRIPLSWSRRGGYITG